ncbi:MAG TPA: hypothetical protein DCG12_10460 [Planctomycetaceae bacterium]|nr:hypothetical protein [Planctomycetaceae bacterium]
MSMAGSSTQSERVAFCRRRLSAHLLILMSVLACNSVPGQETREITDNEKAFFEKRIRPVLVKRCYSCHSEDAARSKKLKGSLLLDSRAGTLRGGESGASIVPGKPDESLLLDAMRHDTLEMPPNEKLNDAVIADFEKWIRMGAPDPRTNSQADLRAISLSAGRNHWSFQPLQQSKPPVAADSRWNRNPIDRFVAQRLAQEGLTPSDSANRATLVRRIYFDLIGLPPPPEQVQAFMDDTSANVPAKLVDELLASEHYGERWGRHWLDVARFGESEGSDLAANAIRPDAYRYRDAVIRAFNQDIPWNEFVALQVAGRGLSTESPLAADLGQFPHLGTRLEGSADPNDKMFHRLDDMVATTGTAFLGLTIGCARCHDHKIDPVTAEEYYRLTAVFFDQVREAPKAGKRTRQLQVPEPHLLAAGSWKRPVRKVTPGFVQVLMSGDAESEDWITTTSDGKANLRMSLARWLTDTERGAGHLLARVIVNRVWQHHFGRGIVDTPNDFGFLGSSPTHPELLDWLAGEFIRNGWRVKPLHRLILSSATWQQSASDQWSQVDAGNQWLWQYQPRRMEGEIVRDNILSVSGSLKTQMFGRSIPVGSLRGKKFQETPETWRRSVYLMVPRFESHPFLKVFDAVENVNSVGARTVSTTPSAALYMLNAPFVWDQAERMAKRVEQHENSIPGEQVRYLYQLMFARNPTNQELELGVLFLDSESAPTGGEQRSTLVRYCHVLLGLNEFIYVR